MEFKTAGRYAGKVIGDSINKNRHVFEDSARSDCAS